jgi:hypothetical protein
MSSQRIIICPNQPKSAPEQPLPGFNVLTGITAVQNAARLNLPMNTAMLAHAIDEVLANEHWLYEKEYRRQFRKWCLIHGTPAYGFNMPNLENETNEAMRRAATAVLSMFE